VTHGEEERCLAFSLVPTSVPHEEAVPDIELMLDGN
jgi:hypothetical protein